MTYSMKAKFGLSLSTRAVLFDWATTDDLIAAARIAEASGYFHGVWVGDNLLSKPRVESIVRSGVKQQKCLAHVLRSISEVVETKRGRGRSFGNRLSRLLREAMELRQAYHRREATYHLRDRPMSDADNWRLQNELGWHHDRGNLLRFLDDPSIEPTNTVLRERSVGQ